MGNDILGRLLDLKDVGSGVAASVIFGVVAFGARGAWAHAQRARLPISVEYWRLFGGATVPLVMRMLGNSYITREVEPPYRFLEFDDGGVSGVSDPVFHFYDELKTKRSQSLIVSKGCLWERYAGSRRAGVRLEFLSKGSSPQEIATWINENDIDQSGLIEIPASTALLEQAANDFSGNVGFLFFKVKNHSAAPVLDLAIDFQHAEVGHLIPSVDYPRDEDYKAIKEAFEAKGPPDRYLPSCRVEYGSHQMLRIPLLEPQQEAIFLIAVYRSDGDGFEQQLLDDVYLPQRMKLPDTSWVPVRSPLRKASLRRKVPYGWFSQ